MERRTAKFTEVANSPVRFIPPVAATFTTLCGAISSKDTYVSQRNDFLSVRSGSFSAFGDRLKTTEADVTCQNLCRLKIDFALCFFGRHPSFSPSSKDKYSRPIHDVVIDGAGVVEVMQVVRTVLDLNLDMPEYETMGLHGLA